MEKCAQQRRIVEMLDSQLLAVLSTQLKGQPYGNLIAFARTNEIGTLLFATPRQTRKYHNLLSSPQVSLLVDNRGNGPDDFLNASAVTALGKAQEAQGKNQEEFKRVLSGRHSTLAPFFLAPSTAVFAVSVKEYVCVTHFGEVVNFFPK